MLVAGTLGWFCGHARNQAGGIRAAVVTHALTVTAWRAFFAEGVNSMKMPAMIPKSRPLTMNKERYGEELTDEEIHYAMPIPKAPGPRSAPLTIWACR